VSAPAVAEQRARHLRQRREVLIQGEYPTKLRRRGTSKHEQHKLIPPHAHCYFVCGNHILWRGFYFQHLQEIQSNDCRDEEERQLPGMDDKEQDSSIFYKIIRLHIHFLFCTLHHFVDYQGFGEFSGLKLFGLPVFSHRNGFSSDSLFQASKK
jgi:hypothetical protein